jgi:hypothetical protein
VAYNLGFNNQTSTGETMTDFLNCPIAEISEQARTAMNSGDDKMASILDALISLREIVEQQEDKNGRIKVRFFGSMGKRKWPRW